MGHSFDYLALDSIGHNFNALYDIGTFRTNKKIATKFE